MAFSIDLNKHEVEHGDLLAIIHNTEPTPQHQAFVSCEVLITARYLPSRIQMGNYRKFIAESTSR